MRVCFIAIAMFAGLGAVGCGGPEDDCETICNWLDECGLDADPDCVDNCVDDYEDADEQCQDAADELAACLEEDDSCGNDSECTGELGNLLEDCEDDL